MMSFGMMGGMLLFWGALIVLAILIVQGLFQTIQSNGTNVPLSARQILEQRYARSEPNREQYLLILEDIQ
jgi:uncharacterized membrane protein